MQHFLSHIHRHFAILLAFTLFASCSPNDPSENSSLLRIQLTDTPMIATESESGEGFPDIAIRDLFIDISSIEVLSVDIDTGTNEEWEMLNFRSGAYNVFDPQHPFTNGRVRRITEQWFPAGRTITKIRITFGNDSHIVNTANHAISLTVPDEIIAETTTGVNVNLHAISSIVIELNTLLMHNERDGFSAIFFPRAFNETSSSLRGSIIPREVRTSILIEHTELPIALRSLTDPQGSFNILGVEPGYWLVSVFPDPESGWLDSIFAEPISVTHRPRINNLPAISLRANVIPPDPEPDPEEPDDDDDDDDDE